MSKPLVGKTSWETDIDSEDLKGLEGIVISKPPTLLVDITQQLTENYSFSKESDAKLVAGKIIAHYTPKENSTFNDKLDEVTKDLKDLKEHTIKHDEKRKAFTIANLSLLDMQPKKIQLPKKKSQTESVNTPLLQE